MKYIDSEKLIAEIERLYNIAKETSYNGEIEGEMTAYDKILPLITALQQEQPMPNSTQLIELWHEDKEMLKEKDFRDDPWRLAYNAFMCGFGRGIAVNKQEQSDVDLEKEIKRFLSNATKMNKGEWRGKYPISDIGFRAVARHFYELGRLSNK